MKVSEDDTPEKISLNKEAFQLICIGASPSFGKTTFLDSLARMNENFLENEEIAQMYNETWFISVSFYGWSEYVNEFNNFETSLSIRLLYSHYFLIEENLKDTFTSFRRDIPTDYRLRIPSAIEIIELDLKRRHSPKKCIVILVDELSTPRINESPVLYIRSLCNIMTKEIDVCFTSLEPISIDAPVGISNRRLLRWISS